MELGQKVRLRVETNAPVVGVVVAPPSDLDTPDYAVYVLWEGMPYAMYTFMDTIEEYNE